MTTKDDSIEDANTLIEKLSEKDKRKLLKAFLLCCLHQLFCELLKNKIQSPDPITECYEMDKKILQILINEIVETGEYTLAGIGPHIHIPNEVIDTAAYGIYGMNIQFSITVWAKIVELYMQVKPSMTLALINKLLELKEKHQSASLLPLLHEGSS